MSIGLSRRAMGWSRALVAVLMVCCCVANAAAEITIDDQRTMLSLTGVVQGEDAASVHVLSGEDLMALPATRIQTGTAISYGSHVFVGPLVRDVLERFALVGDTVRLEALNGYVVDVPASDFYDYDVIFAYSMNGQRLTVRHFGPIWVVYPRDNHKELNDLRYDTRWVWQLRRVTVFNK